MSDKIIPFRKPGAEPVEPEDRLILVCQSCNCMTHYIHDDMKVECANCGQDINKIGELRVDMPLPPEKPRTTYGSVRVTNLGSQEAACAAVLGDIRRWHENKELEVLVGYNKEGLGRNWFNLITEKDREYVLARLDDIRAHVSKAHLHPECERGGINGDNDEGTAASSPLPEEDEGPEGA